MLLCLRLGFDVSNQDYVVNKQLQVPVNAGDNLCHQVPPGNTLNNAITYIHYIMPTIWWMGTRKKMAEVHIDLQNMQD